MPRRAPGFWFSMISALLVAAGAALIALPAPQNSFRFAIIGDRTGTAQPGVYQRVWRDVAGLHPDFAINVGDTIEGGKDTTAEKEWRAVQAIWKPYLRFPYYFTPGNHDIWSDFSRRLWQRATGHPATYSFDYQNAHFTVLDNSQGPFLTDTQMDFLARDLETYKTRSPKFIFFHEPFWLLPLELGSGDFPLHKLAVEYQVACIISGHTHQFARIEKDGVVYLTECSSGGHLRIPTGTDGFAQGWFFGYSMGRVQGTTVEFTVHELGAPFGQGRTFRAENWGPNGPEIINP